MDLILQRPLYSVSITHPIEHDLEIINDSLKVDNDEGIIRVQEKRKHCMYTDVYRRILNCRLLMEKIYKLTAYMQDLL